MIGPKQLYRVEVALIGGQTLVWVAAEPPIKIQREHEVIAFHFQESDGAPAFVRFEHVSAVTVTKLETEAEVWSPSEEDIERMDRAVNGEKEGSWKR